MRPIYVLLPVLMLAACSPSSQSSSLSPSNNTVDVSATTPTAEASSGAWTYDVEKDEMRGTSRRVATVSSDDSYSNTFGMSSRKTDFDIIKDGKRVVARMFNPNLQYTCSAFMETSVAIKIDDGPVRKYRCVDAKGDTFGVLFIPSAAGIEAKLRKAKKMIVEAPVFQKGDVQQTFQVAGYDPNHK